MKLIASGVTNSAARTRSPSFSRSSSSTTITKRPARISSRAASTAAKRACPDVRDAIAPPNEIAPRSAELSVAPDRRKANSAGLTGAGQALHVFRENIRLDVHSVARRSGAETRVFSGKGNECDSKGIVVAVHDRETG